MSKLGKAFQKVVAQVVRDLDPQSTIAEGQWVQGPDGGRELDVIVTGTQNGVPHRINIECKDCNPKGRAIGIAAVDALESKHRDLGMTKSILCSNAGFSIDAIRKAKRVGISLVGALRGGDKRVQYAIMDAVYIRRVKIIRESAKNTFYFAGFNILPPGTPSSSIKFDGIPVGNWLEHRVVLFLTMNPVVKGTHNLHFNFNQIVRLETPAGSALVNGVSIAFTIEGHWYIQQAEIDATSGLYDWVRNTVRIGPRETKVAYKNLKFGTGGKKINCPPDFDPNKVMPLDHDETMIGMLELHGMKATRLYPNLDQFVDPQELDPRRLDLRLADCVSA